VIQTLIIVNPESNIESLIVAPSVVTDIKEISLIGAAHLGLSSAHTTGTLQGAQ
jgi:hypothetical protein